MTLELLLVYDPILQKFQSLRFSELWFNWNIFIRDLTLIQHLHSSYILCSKPLLNSQGVYELSCVVCRAHWIANDTCFSNVFFFWKAFCFLESYNWIFSPHLPKFNLNKFWCDFQVIELFWKFQGRDASRKEIELMKAISGISDTRYQTEMLRFFRIG